MALVACATPQLPAVSLPTVNLPTVDLPGPPPLPRFFRRGTDADSARPADGSAQPRSAPILIASAAPMSLTVVEEEETNAPPAEHITSHLYTEFTWKVPRQSAPKPLRLTITQPVPFAGSAVAAGRTDRDRFGEIELPDVFDAERANGVIVPFDDGVIVQSRRTYEFNRTGLTMVFETSLESDIAWTGRLRLFKKPEDGSD